MEKITERVLAAPRKLFESIGELNGFSLNVQPYLKMLKHREVKFVDRDLVEPDDSLKQVISFIMIKRGDELFVNVRSDTQGDERLLGATSIGVGGHINYLDTFVGHPLGCRYGAFLAGSKREFNEEVKIFHHPIGGLPLHIIGVVNDETSPVGRCHFGIVSMVEIPEDRKVNSFCGSFSETYFRNIHSLEHHADSDRLDMESWSRAIFGKIDEILCEFKNQQENYFPDLIL